METWKDIPDCSDYQVSDLGNVRSCKRKGNFHSKGEWKTIKLKEHNSRLKYLCFGANVNGKKIDKHVHRLVLEVFVGPSDGLDAAHLNGNPHDNRLENLVWVTRKVNMGHAIGHGTIRSGDHHHMTKLSETDIKAIIEMAATKRVTQNAIAELFGVSGALISKILSEQRRVITRKLDRS